MLGSPLLAAPEGAPRWQVLQPLNMFAQVSLIQSPFLT